MKQVTVNVEDLEALVFATGVIKQIESALNVRNDDPFVKPYLKATAAHDRLAKAIRDAKRGEAGTAINYDAALTDAEKRTLLELLDKVDEPFSGAVTIRALDKDKYSSLEAKGCVRFGTPFTGTAWTGETSPTLRKDPKHLVVEITAKGWPMVPPSIEQPPSKRSWWRNFRLGFLPGLGTRL